MASDEALITYRGNTLKVVFDYDKGFAGSWEEPPEPETIEIEDVFLVRDKEDIDITDLLGAVQYQKIEAQLWELRKEV